MIVAASTACIPDSAPHEVFERLADLEFMNAEISVCNEGAITPSDIAGRFDVYVQICRSLRRLSPVSIFYEIDPTAPDYLDNFKMLCEFAKAIKVVVMTVRSSVVGTPYNEEVERLRELVRFAVSNGVLVGLLTEAGHLTETPSTVGSLCKSVKGLGVTLDPSHYIFNHTKPIDYDMILGQVCHVRLRDTTPTQFQVRIGQGVLEFGRLVIQLNKVNYRRALCIDLAELPDIDPMAELRKMRLLVESLL
ncbi:MAG: TIM barrel protein [Planctomycetaceae bacterium]|nr:TIM barrel protein [Planctomycetaceae bacterium]